MSGTGDRRGSPTAQALFEQEGLPFPPVPAELAASLRPAPQSEFVFATRPLGDSPYDIEAFVQEAEAASQPDYAVVGFDGHGISSWAAHCYVVCEELALFIQHPWGGAYLDADRARSEITERFRWAGELQAAVRRASRQGRIPQGWRLLVVATPIARRSGWRWLVPGRDGSERAQWNAADGMEPALTKLLDDLMAGRTVPRA